MTKKNSRLINYYKSSLSSLGNTGLTLTGVVLLSVDAVVIGWEVVV
jgi:hypothetical protein